MTLEADIDSRGKITPVDGFGKVDAELDFHFTPAGR
jgi:hypothetical protein